VTEKERTADQKSNSWPGNDRNSDETFLPEKIADMIGNGGLSINMV
jgi:hypothetical protein